MFCPNCGSKEAGSIQYCRFCGTNLRNVRIMVDDSVTVSDAARKEIGNAIAAKIRQTSSADELAKFTEGVLPEIRKFLETNEEKRLRRIRAGSMVSLIGLGTAIAFYIAAALGPDKDVIVLAALGLVAFFIGLALFLNGLFFTMPQNAPAGGERLDPDEPVRPGRLSATTNELLMPAGARSEFSSVTEETTRLLKKEL